jgi:hydroxypyruvate reductase
VDAIGAQTQPSPHAEFGHVTNIIVGNNSTALDAAARAAVAQGFASEIIDRELAGEAHLKGKVLADALTSAAAMRSRPFCLLAGGETTVTLDADGKGGRNQELALAAVDKIAGMQNVALVTLATDGNDGPTDAAGAVATGESAERAARAGLRAGAYLARHDSYLFFEALEDLLKPGYTGTNVNDLVLLCGL